MTTDLQTQPEQDPRLIPDVNGKFNTGDTKLDIDLETIAERVAIVQKVPSTLSIITGKVDRAKLAMSKIQTITDDATDTIAESLLVKVRNTYTEVNKLRTDITGCLDDVKKILSEPEKQIDIDAKATGSEYNRLRGLRNKYAIDKAAAAKKAAEKLQREKDEANEISRVTAAIKQQITDGVLRAITDMNVAIADHVGGMTLENWDVKKGKFEIKPVLKLDKYQSFLQVQYNQQLINPEIYAGIVTEVEKTNGYTVTNAIYVQQAEGVIKMWVDGLDEKKQALQNLADLQQTNAMAAAVEKRRMDEEAQQQSENIIADAQRLHASTSAAIADEKAGDDLQAEFKAQVGLQAVPEQKGLLKSKKAVIISPDADIVKTFTEILYQCYMHPKFPGHLKRDKEGRPVPQVHEGVPVYAEWAQTLLDFVAKECDKEIKGVKMVEVISTTAKAPKKPA